MGGGRGRGSGLTPEQRQAELKQNKKKDDLATTATTTTSPRKTTTGVMSFFDDLTTAKDVGEGRIGREEEKALNLDTFGVSSLYSGGRGGRGGYRRGRGYHHHHGRGSKPYYPRQPQGPPP